MEEEIKTQQPKRPNQEQFLALQHQIKVDSKTVRAVKHQIYLKGSFSVIG